MKSIDIVDNIVKGEFNEVDKAITSHLSKQSIDAIDNIQMEVANDVFKTNSGNDE